MKKRILAIFLCVSLCLGLVPGVALGETVPQARGKYYDSRENTFDPDFVAELNIPAGTNHDIALFAPDGTEPLSGYTAASVDEDVFTVRQMTSDGGVDYVSITGTGTGGTDLLITLGGMVAYRFHVTVTPEEQGGSTPWPAVPCLYYRHFDPRTGELREGDPRFSLCTELGGSVPIAVFCHVADQEEDILITPDKLDVTRGGGTWK